LKPDHSEPGNFHSLALWHSAGRPATVFGATDMGAVFAFAAARAAPGSAQSIGRKWVRSIGAKISTQAVFPADAPGAALWVGTADGAVIRLDPATGTMRDATKATGSPVVQFVEQRGEVHALHGDGVVETFAPRNTR
jgi:hypothetical protein